MTLDKANEKYKELVEEYFIRQDLITKYVAIVNEYDFDPQPNSYYIEIGIKGRDALNIIEDIKYASDQYPKSIEAMLFIKKFINSKAIVQDIKKGNQSFAYSDDIVLHGQRDDYSTSQKRYKKLTAGMSISNFNDTTWSGTAGAFFRQENSEEIYMISNKHILASVKNSKSIVHPSNSDAQVLKLEKEKNNIGELIWKCTDNMDAAVAKISHAVEVNEQARCKDVKFKGLAKARIGMRVKKCGRSTGITYGVVRSVNSTINVLNEGNGKVKLYFNQIITSYMDNHGDSGSVLVNDEDKIIGLLFAGNKAKSASYYHDINLIFSRLAKETHINKPIFNLKPTNMSKDQNVPVTIGNTTEDYPLYQTGENSIRGIFTSWNDLKVTQIKVWIEGRIQVEIKDVIYCETLGRIEIHAVNGGSTPEPVLNNLSEFEIDNTPVVLVVYTDDDDDPYSSECHMGSDKHPIVKAGNILV